MSIMRIGFYLLWWLILAVIQPTLGRGIAVWDVAPNFFLCFVVMVGFYRGRFEGAICGAVFGVLYDILIGRMIGVSGLSYLYIGFGAGILSHRFFQDAKRVAVAAAIPIGTVVAALVYYLALRVTQGEVSFVTMIFRTALPEAIYNGLVGFLLTFPVVKTMKLFRLMDGRG